MKRALVFGSQIEGLSGVEHDTAAVKDMLEARGFQVDLRTGSAATRDGIIAGYEALIEAVQSDRGAGDPAAGAAAVVYYSGHGCYGALPDDQGTWQAIVPTDLRQGTDADFRGITAWELSILQAKLTEQTHNVTVILDCCHSSQMSKDAADRHAVPRGLPHPIKIGLAAHLEALSKKYGTVPALDPLGNPHAVRLVAAAQDESAYEYRTASGAQGGAFTEALLDVLAQVGTSEITWAAVGDAVRARVRQNFTVQRPDVEGPRQRIVFSLHEANADGIVSLRVAGAQLELPAGRLTGVTERDVYGIMPVGSLRHDAARAIAEAEVTALGPLAAQLEVRTWLNNHAAVPVDAVAVPLVRNAVRRPIAIPRSGPQRDALERAIHGHKVLRIAEAGERALGTLQLDGDLLTLSDELGPLYPPAKLTDAPAEAAAELDRMVHNAANLAFAQAVRDLVGEHDVYATELGIELGVVEDRAPRRLRDHGAALGLRDRFYIKVTNRGARKLYAHVFNVGMRSTVSLLTANAAPAGVLLPAGESHVLGKHPSGTLLGVEIGWPDGLPRDVFPRRDEYIVLVTSSPVNLGALEAQARSGRKAGGGSKLLGLLSQLQDGAPRDARIDDPMEGYLARSLSYQLYPCEARLGGVAPEGSAAPGIEDPPRLEPAQPQAASSPS